MALNYRSNSAAAEVVRAISSTGGTAVAMQGDLSPEATVSAFFASFDLAGLPPLSCFRCTVFSVSTAAVWCTVVIAPPR